eukprot:5292140-Amphidinium_carterae.1
MLPSVLRSSSSAHLCKVTLVAQKTSRDVSTSDFLSPATLKGKSYHSMVFEWCVYLCNPKHYQPYPSSGTSGRSCELGK